jgi:allophanate hydrolase
MIPALPTTVRQWLAAYAQGADPHALLAGCRRRIRDATPANTWIHHVPDVAFEAQLAALDAMQAAARDRRALLARYPLFGVPFAVKDNIDIEGAPTTAACPAYERVAVRSAAAVRRLQAAGAVWLGKTNLDQFATGLTGTRSPYGKPASVLSAEHVSGGSSSGSAVAVALGAVAFSLGTDTAGSGRVPAGFNRLVGMKPTPGRVSTAGVVPACRSLDCVSVFALTVDDAAHVLATIEGPDAEDCYSHFEPGPAGWTTPSLRIGIPNEIRIASGSGYAEPYAGALAHALALGHTLVPIDFEPLHRTADLLYAGPWVAERYSVVETLLAREPLALDPTVRTVIASASRYSATDTFRAQYALKELQAQTATVWDDVDVLLVPTAPNHPRFTDVAADPVGANAALGVYTNFVNLLGWCALALPAGTTTAGLPFGITFIAPAQHDAALAALGRAWQASVDLPLGATGLALADDAACALDLRRPAVRETLPLAVVGAHLSGMPLNGQLRERGARLARSTTTAPRYRLYALPGTTPPKPGLVRSTSDGHAIAVEVWEVPLANVGSFLALIAPPLGLGSIELADGTHVHGFVCESYAIAGARDVSSYGGWRAYVESLAAIATAD